MDGQKIIRYALSGIVILAALLPAAAYSAVFAALILFIYQGKWKKALPMLSSDTPLLLLIGSILVSAVFSQAKLLSMAAVFLLLIQLAFYVMLSAEGEAYSENNYFRLMTCLNILVCLYGLYQLITGNLTQYSSWVDEKSYGVLVRIYATFGNPNIFAGYLVMHLSFAVAKVKEKKRDALLTSSILLSSACLLLTYSRGAFAGFCAAMLALFLIKRKKRLLVYASVMLAAFILLNYTGGGINRADVFALGQDTSSLYRLEIWKSAAAMFMRRPFFGNGYGTAWYFLAEGSDKLFRYVLHAHNIFLQIAAEMGVAGIVCTAVFACLELKKSVSLLKSKVRLKDAYFIEGFVALSAAVVVHGLLDAVIFLPAFGMIGMAYFTLYKRAAYKYQLMYQKAGSEGTGPYERDELAI